MVVEAHGGGGSKVARQVLDEISKHIAANWREDSELASLAVAQRLSTTLRWENARAIARRLMEQPESCTTESVPLDGPMAD